jgi:hypothetical protein
MNKNELIELVKKIKRCDGTEKEIDDMIVELERNVIYPEVSDLIFYSEKTAVEIVDLALSYKPIQL